MMAPMSNPLRHPETVFQVELQVFSGLAPSPHDPSLVPPTRKGSPAPSESLLHISSPGND